jgi:hypothetical protein
LLDPQNPAVSLNTLARAAHVLGKRLVWKSEMRSHKDYAQKDSNSTAGKLP